MSKVSLLSPCFARYGFSTSIELYMSSITFDRSKVKRILKKITISFDLDDVNNHILYLEPKKNSNIAWLLNKVYHKRNNRGILLINRSVLLIYMGILIMVEHKIEKASYEWLRYSFGSKVEIRMPKGKYSLIKSLAQTVWKIG